MWRETALKRVAYCGRVVAGDCAGVGVHSSADGKGGFSGLQTCGSVWACPVCAEKINAERQAELAAGIERWLAPWVSELSGPECGKRNCAHVVCRSVRRVGRRGAVVFGTLTVQHNKGHKLADLWDGISPAWNRTTSGAGVAWNGGKSEQGDRANFGIEGYVRLVETKSGGHGWHPHIHTLFFLDHELTEVEIEDFRARLFGRWSKALVKEGFKTLEFDRGGQAVGVDLRPVKSGQYMADYFAKNGYAAGGTASAGAAYEVTGSQSKQAGKGGRTPFQVLRDIVDGATGEVVGTFDGEAFDRDRSTWHEWEQASHGRRQITWSRGMRNLLALGVERTDEEIAAESEEQSKACYVFTAEEWKIERWHLHRAALLRAAELGGARAVWDLVIERRARRHEAGLPTWDRNAPSGNLDARPLVRIS